MNSIQEAKLRMYRAVEAYLTANNPIISANVAFMTAFTAFQAKIAAIAQAAQADDVPIKGITMDKNETKLRLCERASMLADMISAYAVTVGNNTLRMEVNVSLTALMRMRDEALVPRCRNIHQAGADHLAALADYGVTTATLSGLENRIAAYIAVLPKRRIAVSERKAITANLINLFKETDEILENRMDKLAQTFRAAHPDFVKTYEAARRIVRMPTTHTQLKGTVSDAAADTPIPAATVTATPTKTGATPLTTTTDQAGDYSFKPIPNGDTQITVTAPGYNDFQTEIDVILGEINDLDVEMVK